MAKKKSSLRTYFVNTGTTASPTWASLGKGITSLAVDYGAQTTTETYVNEDAANTSVDSYQASAALDITLWDATSAPAHAYIEGLRDDMATGADAETEILEIDLTTTSPYTAFVHSAVIAIGTHTMTGGSPQTLSATVYYNGAPETGTAVITAGVPVFTAAS
jgi:hypothetical protein